MARMVLFGDVCGRPVGAPVVEVVAVAKRELRAGEELDTFGGYLTYGQAEDAAGLQARSEAIEAELLDALSRWEALETKSAAG